MAGLVRSPESSLPAELQIASEDQQEVVPVDEIPGSQLSDDEVVPMVVPVEDTYVVPVSRPVY